MNYLKKGMFIGWLIGLILSYLQVILKNVCNNSISYLSCALERNVTILGYFPIALVFRPIYSDYGIITNENLFLIVLILIVPVLLYSLIGGLIGEVLDKYVKNARKK